jgi:hypothetical protein
MNLKAKLQIKFISIKSTIIGFFMLYFVPIYSLFAANAAETKQTIGQTLINVSRSLPNIMIFISGFTVVVGVIFIILALFKLKHLADFRNMMSGQQEIGKAIMMITIGVIFIWMPFMLQVFTVTIFGEGIGALQARYPVAAGSNQYYVAFFRIMQVVGVISFVRGWFILAGMAKGQHQPGTFGKSMTHIVAGIFLFHLKAFMGIAEQTLGFSFINP